MGKYIEVVKREGRYGLDFILESRVTGEVFLLLLENPDNEFPLFEELRKVFVHIKEIRRWVKDGIIKFSGNQVVYMKVYC